MVLVIMKLRYAYSFVIALFLLQAAQADESTWLALPARGQLELDPTLIPKGKGFLFVPAMTSALNEPNYQVFQGKREVVTASPGTGVLLLPGYYKILIGSGSVSQMMSRTVEVVEGYTTLVKPFWAGLVIHVIDENRTSVNESYELFREDNQENYGIGFGIEEERGEAVKTWLLEPGVYTVLGVGDNISTPRKFSVRLDPGELIQRNLVVDVSTKSFIGFYPPLGLPGRTSRGATSWKTQWQLSGSVLFNTTQNTAGEDRSSISLSTQVHNRSVYNTKRHFASLRVILEEGLTKEKGDAFRKSIDELEFRSTYIYRMSERIGPYLRGVVTSKLFDTEVRYAEPHNLYLVSAEGDTTETLIGIKKFTISPSLSPLQLRQGIGINSQFYRSFRLNVNLRIGLGARQTYVFDSFDLSGSIARRLQDATSTGLEALLIMDARLTRYALLDSEVDILMPSVNTDSWEFTWENRLRIGLSRFVNMDIVFDFQRQAPLRRLESRQQVLLRFVYLL